mgnify:CR=1 FL=1
MASGKEYLHFILEQLSDLDDISYRPMMGEFILYYRGKIVGGIYDDRLLVKKLIAKCFLQSSLRQCSMNCHRQNERTTALEE